MSDDELTASAAETAVSDWPDEAADPLCLSPGDAAHLLRGAPYRRFAVVGDSFAAGTGDASPGYEPLSWPDRVLRALRDGAAAEVAYQNTGVVGARAGQVREAQLQQAIDFQPDLVVIAAGGNDLFVPSPDLDEIEAGLDSLYAPLHEQGAQFVAFTVANVFDQLPNMEPFRDLMAALNARIRRVAERYDAALVEMWEHPVRHRDTLMSADGVHFALAGQAVLATEIVKALSSRSSSWQAGDTPPLPVGSSSS